MPTSVLDGQSGDKLLRKPFAIRDYPPGVGPNAARIHVKPKEDTAKGGEANLQHSASRRFVSAIRDYPPFCGRNSRGLSKADVSKLMQRRLAGVREERKRKLDCLTRGDLSKAVMRTEDSLNHSNMKVLKKKEGNAASGAMAKLVVIGKNGHDTNYRRKFSDGHRSYGVNVPLLHHRNLSIHNSNSIVPRITVRDTLRSFQALCRKLLKEVEAQSKGQAKIWKRIDLEAANILKKEGKYINEGKIFGSVPGVEIGDEFDYRVELNLVGLHHNIQAGIDYATRNGEHLATSIVASGGYNDELDSSGVLIYSGHGGNVMSKKKEPEDQKLERGNLALKNSSKKKNPVRVIRGAFFGGGSRRTFVYDGLYEVESYWQERGPHGKMVFKFQLRRIPNQPELPWLT
ncbi:hypothetical protein QN277_009109 [Acacia crassicarpa]|uniref:YDG domain-containing protein n=1 Tax=Acacia crassicarpa TaxID=499986 RepID=A0AAE1ISB4_9FABA|nr:hypothetical protein QN277_009109 [Acacia crassicarpa]